MSPSDLFEFCPRCGVRHGPGTGGGPFRCRACGFLYYFNPCCAVAGLVLNERGEVLLLRRAKDPAQGKLAVPGGFIDIGETAEEALRRETREETDLELNGLVFLCSQINSYPYQGVTYPVLDLFFTTTAIDAGAARALDDTESLAWMQPSRVDPAEIAFPSIREALRLYCARTIA